MATLTKTLTLSSPAGDMLSDALSLSMTKDVTINGAGIMKKLTINTANSDDAIAIAPASGRSIVYVKNVSTSDNTISIYNDALIDADTNLTDGTAADSTGSAFELIMEVKQNEFAVFPAALDFPLIAVAASTGGLLEVGIFTES